MSDECYEFVPLDELTVARGGCFQVYENYYWTVHPEKGALFFRLNKRVQPVPQCNSNRLIVERRLQDRGMDGLIALQAPLAFVPHRCEA